MSSVSFCGLGVSIVKRMKQLVLLTFLALCLSLPARADLTTELLAGRFDASRVDELIAENAADPQIAFDLLGEKALDPEIAVEAATEAHVLRAALAVRFPEQITDDLPSLLLDAADALLAAGDTAAALEHFYAALQALRDRAARRETLAELLSEIAALEERLGNTEQAAGLRASAEALPDALNAPPANRSSDLGYVNVDVFYATDRARTGKTRPARFYGYGRAEALDYGIAEVTIPRTHVPGSLAAPTIWKLEFSEDPTKHVMLQSVTPVAADNFFGSMRERLDDVQSKEAFVFVHGYNVSFDDAAKRAAQMAYDMNFKGIPVLYSWPSRGATIGYIPDTAVVRFSGRRLTRFLEDLVAQSGATTIHIVAHSMGNRAVTDALELLALRLAPIEAPVFDQIIFAAPDVDMSLFSAMLPTIRPLARRLTLYGSEKDWALLASQKLHGDAPRAGQGGADALVHGAIDTIDMSSLGEDMLAHSYVANDRSALLDISMLFWRNTDPQNRCGLKKREGDARIWLYEQADCTSQSMLDMVGQLWSAGITSPEDARTMLRTTFANSPQLPELEPLLVDMVTE